MKFSNPHTQLVHSCYQYLTLRGVFCWCNNTGAATIQNRFIRFGQPGLPDIFVLVNGRLGALECKTGTGKLSAAQLHMQTQLLKNGCSYHVVRSLAQLESIFGAIGSTKTVLNDVSPLLSTVDP